MSSDHLRQKKGGKLGARMLTFKNDQRQQNEDGKRAVQTLLHRFALLAALTWGVSLGQRLALWPERTLNLFRIMRLDSIPTNGRNGSYRLTMKKEKRRKRKPDALRVQIKLRVRPGVKPTAGRMETAVKKWIDSGDPSADPDIEISAIHWQNPDRKKPELRQWRKSTDTGQSLEEARLTLRLKEWLRGQNNIASALRPGRGIGSAKPAATGLRPAKNSKPKRNLRGSPHRRTQAAVGTSRQNKKRVARRSTAKRAGTPKHGRNHRAASRYGKRQAARNHKPHARPKHRTPRSGR